MSDRNREVVPGARAPVLSAALLARTHELNRDYVELLLAARDTHPVDVAAPALPGKILDALLELGPDARAALVTCPYTLYSLGFEDQRFWSTALAAGHAALPTAGIAERYGALSAAPMHAAFCEIALLFAWHTAQSHRLAARFLFAMPDHVATQLQHTPLWQLRRIAVDYPGLLSPRWPSNPAFWPDLVRFAAAGDVRRLETAQLLGGQLIASELDGSLPRGRPRIRVKAMMPA